MPIYEWDEAKRAQNLAKHKVDFSAVRGMDWRQAISDPQFREGETRFITVGPIGDRLHCLIWTWRDENVRVISLRKANSREERAYDIATQETDQPDP
ncbi:MAG: BrnT family toxin [Oceanicaulis sp.]